MSRVTLRFEILTYWHAGTGRGDGDRADAVIHRDADGLPYLPGRTVKGLLRSAAEVGVHAGLLTSDELLGWFGTRLVSSAEDADDDRVQKLESARFTSGSGSLRFSSATLGSEWRAWAVAHPADTELLATTLASTAIGADGRAADHTLRTIEVAPPMTLAAVVDGPDGRWRESLGAIAPLLRNLGSGRNRGMGRVRVTVEASR